MPNSTSIVVAITIAREESVCLGEGGHLSQGGSCAAGCTCWLHDQEPNLFSKVVPMLFFFIAMPLIVL
jgi:hypothetical protein